EEKGREWATAYAASITQSAGQFCTNPGLVLGIKGVALSNFITSLGSEIEKIDPSCMLHPRIHESYEKNKTELSAQPNITKVADLKGNLPPNYAGQRVLTVNAADFLGNPILHREVFGPFSIVVQCADKAELLTVIQELDGQ